MRFIVAAKDGAVPRGFACVEHGLLSSVKLARPGRALGAPSSISAARVCWSEMECALRVSFQFTATGTQTHIHLASVILSRGLTALQSLLQTSLQETAAV